MPYSGSGDSSLPDHVKKMPKKKKAQWVAVWNETYNSCIKDGGKSSNCETKAFKAANGTVSQFAERNEAMSFNAVTLRKVWDKFLDHILGEIDKKGGDRKGYRL